MKRQYLLMILMLSMSVGIFAQANLLNAKTPSDIGKKTDSQLSVNTDDKPLEYGYIDDRDILWSKVVWEYLDLNELINLPIYYPVDTVNVPLDRRSLFDTLIRGIKGGEVTEIYTNSYFNIKLTKSEVISRLSRVDTLAEGYDALNSGQTNIDEYIDRYDLVSQDIEAFQIKGVWYFDKRQGEFRYRLLGIAPVAPDVQVKGREDEIDISESLAIFWVFFPDARDILHRMKVFNRKNSAYPISYDHLLNARRFNSIIYKEENVHGDREVSDYVRGNSLFQVIESDKIKEKIRNKELDMWAY